jgi:hypothetical protein
MPYQVYVKRRSGRISGEFRLRRDPTPKVGDVITCSIGNDQPIRIKVTAVHWSGQRTPDDNQPIDMVDGDEIGPCSV